MARTKAWPGHARIWKSCPNTCLRAESRSARSVLRLDKRENKTRKRKSRPAREEKSTANRDGPLRRIPALRATSLRAASFPSRHYTGGITTVTYQVAHKLVDGRGFEPPTPALRTRCSPS